MLRLYSKHSKQFWERICRALSRCCHRDGNMILNIYNFTEIMALIKIEPMRFFETHHRGATYNFIVIAILFSYIYKIILSILLVKFCQYAPTLHLESGFDKTICRLSLILLFKVL